MLRPLFVTHLYQASLADQRGFAALNDDLLDACRMLAAEDRAGRAWSRANGYAGYTSYASLDDLPARATAFADLKRRLDRCAAECAAALHLDLDGQRLKMEGFWVNVLKPGGLHSGHIHPGSALSGTYYVAIPPGASALKLEDPRLPMMMAAPPRVEDAPESEKSFVYVQPDPGTVLIWESWLRHEVVVNRAKSERVSISFNYALA